MGWPGPTELPGRCRVWTYGAARVSAAAAADLLAGGPAPTAPRQDAENEENPR